MDASASGPKTSVPKAHRRIPSNSGFFRPGPMVLPAAFTAAMHGHGLRGKHAPSTKLKAICMRPGPWSKRALASDKH